MKGSSGKALKATALAALLVLSLSGCSWFGSGKKAEKKPAAAAKAPAPVTCPLCGSAVTDTGAIMQRPCAVKVENDPAARPQSGLDRACIVYEEVTEGGITRFMAVFLCRSADEVGPVRSARPADIELAFPFNPLFCHCGGGPQTLSLLERSGICDLDEMAWTGAYWRSSDRRAPHNLYSATARLRQAGNGAYPWQGEVASPLSFLDQAGVVKLLDARASELARILAAASSPGKQFTPKLAIINGVNVPYDPTCVVRWQYDPASGRFLRFVAGKPHADGVTGTQLAADTVVLQYVTESPSGVVDVNGVDSPDLGVLGFGRAQVFMGGQLIDANWEKNTREEHTRYTDNYGKVIDLKPGSIWVELVPADRQATLD
ncbi:MAG: DUF3048 domain-containing protein [Actinobacteria bacterium]|nr:DUF3048 domain-containing protein [Actinomycetota bacterium]MBU1942094.1 DUF3048 domain-containing protein [Actinomycetota bacterium]MBU2687355.1 DUF3048 domain-containing protein [Actinomycetota bacterium]